MQVTRVAPDWLSQRLMRLHSGGRRRRSSARSACSTDRSDAPDWTLAPWWRPCRRCAPWRWSMPQRRSPNWAISRASAIRASSCPISGSSPASIPVVPASDTAICTYRSPRGSAASCCVGQEVQPSPIREIAWKAQLRRCGLSHVLPQRQVSQYRHCRDRPWAGCLCPGLRSAAHQSIFAKQICRTAVHFSKRIRRTGHQPSSRSQLHRDVADAIGLSGHCYTGEGRLFPRMGRLKAGPRRASGR